MARKKPTKDEIDAVKATLKRGYDRFMALSDEEKTRAAEAADRQVSRPLSPAQRAQSDEMGIGRAGRPQRIRAGRPAKGQGARQISVTMERGLLLRVDRYVGQKGLTRAQFLAQAAELALAG